MNRPRSVPLAALALLMVLAPAARAQTPATPPCPPGGPCCVPDADPCTRPGLSRGVLALASGAALAGGGLGFKGGDSLGAGDPYAQMIGTGLIGLAGAGIGALLGLLSPRGETAVLDRPSRPTFRVGLAPSANTTLDEVTPYGLSLSFDPTLTAGDAFQIQPSAGASFGLGDSVDVDPRPQLQAVRPGQESTFPVGLTRSRIKVTAGAELAWKLPYPLRGLHKPAFAGRFEVRYRPTVEVRRVTRHPGTSQAQVTEHVALYPALLGFRWHVSPRQRFTFFAGPRIDWISSSDPGSATLRRGSPVLGAFYAEAWYQVDVPFPPLGGGETRVTGRFNLGYIHSRLDGQGFDFGPSIGFFGPVNVSWDFRIRRREAPVALQISAGVWLTDGGGPYVEIGLVTPDIALPGRGAPG